MKIGIADSQGMVRYSLRVLLEQQPDWIVCGEAEDRDALFDLVNHDTPDILLLDWELPDLMPEVTLCQLRAQFSGLKIVIMSGRPEQKKHILQAGADGIASKAESPEKLLAVLRDLEMDKRLSQEPSSGS